jgi:hypothetical protein
MAGRAAQERRPGWLEGKKSGVPVADKGRTSSVAAFCVVVVPVIRPPSLTHTPTHTHTHTPLPSTPMHKQNNTEVKATKEEMDKAQIDLSLRDACAHLLIPLNKYVQQ